MDFITKLERKYGKYAIPNLTLFLIGGFVIGYLIQFIDEDILNLFALNPARVMEGQIYRLITWVIIPPMEASLLVIINIIFYFSIGRDLENIWGDFRYNLYILSGIIFTDIGMMATYFIMEVTGNGELLEYYYMNGLYGASTYFICMSMLLACAVMIPDMKVYMYFLIPFKLKWLGYLNIAYLIITILQFGMWRYYTGMITVIMSILNFIVFYFATKSDRKISAAHKKRKRTYKKTVRQTQIMTRHKCAICGQTEEDDPNLEFRYCSRCNGNYEYCNKHLFTHEHKK